MNWRQDFFRQLMSAEDWPYDRSLPDWQMHRGYHLNEIENSMAALIAAKKSNVNMCEFDVRMTRDEVPVLFHDKSLQRIFGFDLNLFDLTWQQIVTEYKLPIVRLQDVLVNSKIPDFLNIEIKSEEIWNDSIERKIFQVIQATPSNKKIIFSSFNPFSIWKLQNYLPHIPRALIIGRKTGGELKSMTLRELWFAPLLRLHGLHIEHSLLREPWEVQKWKKKGYYIAAWTVHTYERAIELKLWGVDSIISDQLPPSGPLQPR